MAVRTIAIALSRGTLPRAPRNLMIEVAISLGFAVVAWLVRAATPGAAACGGVICLLLTECTVTWPRSLLTSALPALGMLFVLTFLATRYGRARKEARGLAEARTGRRASQVIANIGVAGLCAGLGFGTGFLPSGVAYCAALAAIAEATADTLSSEIGQAVGGPAFLITTRRRVAPGTDGAVSLAGTLTGLLGATIVVLAGMAYLAYVWRETPMAFVTIFAAIFGAATAGLLFDSLLGATVERRGWIGNDLVNFASTAFSAAIVYPLILLAVWLRR